MSLFGAMDASTSALQAQRLRLNVTAENIANAESVGYRRKDVVLRQATGGGGFADALQAAKGVEVAAVVADQDPQRRVLDPTHPDADAQGYVTLPNVDSVTEMTELISASRSYEANVTAMQTAKTLFSRTLELLR
jgi:flagellar basal-body rod protein FlgC